MRVFSLSAMIKRIEKKQLGEILLEKGVIHREQLKQALAVQEDNGNHGKGNGNGHHKFTGEILVELGFTDEETIFQAFATQYQFPYLPLAKYQINTETLNIVPEKVAAKHNLIPVDKLGSILTIAISNPLNKEAIKEIEGICKCDVRIFVTTPADIKIHIKKYYNGEINNAA